MKILMLTPYLPFPPSSGGQVRSYNLLKNLGKKHKIVLVALIKNDSEKKYVADLKDYCEKIYVCKRSESPWTMQNIFRSIFGLYPFLVVRNYSKEAKETVYKLLQENNFYLIHAETFYIMPHIPETKIPILLVEQTIEYMVYQHFVKNSKLIFIKPLFYFDILKLKFWEKSYWQKADLVGAMSEIDRQQMIKIIPDLKVEIIPNAAGEDLSLIYQTKKTEKPIFLYQGNFFWLQNIEAARLLIDQIFPEIIKKIPSAICYIAGQKAKEKLGAIKTKGIKIIDIEPSDVDTVKKVYQQASIFLAPIKGPGGTRLKILGAMAAGLPVISSPTGVSGLFITDRENVLIAKNNQDFVKLAVEIFKSRSLYETIRQNAKKLVEEKYNWNTVSSKLEQIYLKLTKTK